MSVILLIVGSGLAYYTSVPLTQLVILLSFFALVFLFFVLLFGRRLSFLHTFLFLFSMFGVFLLWYNLFSTLPMSIILNYFYTRMFIGSLFLLTQLFLYLFGVESFLMRYALSYITVGSVAYLHLGIFLHPVMYMCTVLVFYGVISFLLPMVHRSHYTMGTTFYMCGGFLLIVLLLYLGPVVEASVLSSFYYSLLLDPSLYDVRGLTPTPAFLEMVVDLLNPRTIQVTLCGIQRMGYLI